MSGVSEGLQVLSYRVGADVPMRHGPLLGAFALLFFGPMAWLSSALLVFELWGIDLSSGITWNTILTMGVEVAGALVVVAVIVLFARALDVPDFPADAGGRRRGRSRFLIAMAVLLGMLWIAESVCRAEADSFLATSKPLLYRVAEWISLLTVIPESVLLAA